MIKLTGEELEAIRTRCNNRFESEEGLKEFLEHAQYDTPALLDEIYRLTDMLEAFDKAIEEQAAEIDRLTALVEKPEYTNAEINRALTRPDLYKIDKSGKIIQRSDRLDAIRERAEKLGIDVSHIIFRINKDIELIEKMVGMAECESQRQNKADER